MSIPRTQTRGAHPDARTFELIDVQALLATVKAATTITTQLEAILRDEGVTLRANDFDALVFLVGEGPMRPAELLRRTAMTHSPATLHAILARLEKHGFAKREPAPEHKRGVLYRATSAGEEVIEQVWPEVERQAIQRFAGHYSDDELVMLKGLASRI